MSGPGMVIGEGESIGQYILEDLEVDRAVESRSDGEMLLVGSSNAGRVPESAITAAYAVGIVARHNGTRNQHCGSKKTLSMDSKYNLSARRSKGRLQRE